MLHGDDMCTCTGHGNETLNFAAGFLLAVGSGVVQCVTVSFLIMASAHRRPVLTLDSLAFDRVFGHHGKEGMPAFRGQEEAAPKTTHVSCQWRGRVEPEDKAGRQSQE